MGKEVEFPPFPSKILPSIFHEEGSFTGPFLKTEAGSQLWLFVQSKAFPDSEMPQGLFWSWLQRVRRAGRALSLAARFCQTPDTFVDPK